MTATITAISMLGAGLIFGGLLGWLHRGDSDATRIGKLRRGRLPFDGKLLDRSRP